MSKLIKRLKPKKSKEEARKEAEENVVNLFKQQDKKNAARFDSDLKKAQAADERQKKSAAAAGSWTGPITQERYRQGLDVAGVASGNTAVGETLANKDKGRYSSSPTPVGGTKKMIKRGKKEYVKNFKGSPQGLRSFKKAH